MDACLRGSVTNWSHFKGQETANLLWALATLNAPVGDLVDHLSDYFSNFLRISDGTATETIAGILKRQELANIAWSCAVFGSFPKSLMASLYAGLLGYGADRDPERMNSIYGDGGLQSQEVMTLIYVQMAVAQAGYADDTVLSLPETFPAAWQSGYYEGQARQRSSETSFDLSLTTSGLQKMVSDAFHRIGFDHYQEYVITTKDLAEEYGIHLFETQMEVLSLDIAHPEARIAIEVDGPSHYACQIDKGVEMNGVTKISRGKLEYQFQWDGKIQCTNGPTALKRRLLEHMGWKVISIPFWDWTRMDGDMEAEENYCRSLLGPDI